MNDNGEQTNNNQQNTQKDKRGGLRSTSWKPGYCPNPRGRPRKGQTWKDQFIKVGKERMRGPGGKRITTKEALARALYLQAIGGNTSAARIVMEYEEGLPKQELGVTLESSERQTVRTELRRILEIAARDPAKREKILHLQSIWLETERELADLASEVKDVTPIESASEDNT